MDSGFAATPLTDPMIVADISGNSRLNALDASLVASFAALIDVPQIPPIPAGVVVAGLSESDLGLGVPGAVTLPAQPFDRPADASDTPESEQPSMSSDIFYPEVDRAIAELGDLPVHIDEDELLLALAHAVAELLSAGLLPD